MVRLPGARFPSPGETSQPPQQPSTSTSLPIPKRAAPRAQAQSKRLSGTSTGFPRSSCGLWALSATPD